ncbi:MAG: glutathione S-transferase family protein [Ramlibacter sp.]|nr:glutathione S-transferase family protein [Ramlibacter sp.]
MPATPLKLYHAWLSSASRRVRLCLAEKNIAYESIAVDLSRQEQHSPRFLAMNPNGVVPALELEPGRFLHESATICEYLDDIQPDPPLRPADAYDRAVMRNFMRWTDEKALPSLLILNWSLMLRPAASQWSDSQLEEKLARIPTAERREAWIRIARRPYTDAEKSAALATLLDLLARMEAMLQAGTWLTGDRYGLADIAAVPFVARLAELAPDALSGERHPRVQAWWRAVQQRPAFAAARLQRFSDAQKERAQADAGTIIPSGTPS